VLRRRETVGIFAVMLACACGQHAGHRHDLSPEVDAQDAGADLRVSDAAELDANATSDAAEGALDAAGGAPDAGSVDGAVDALPACVSTTPTVTVQSLLGEMSSLDHLMRPAVPFYVTRQSSSYDRRSTSPNADGWFDNQDWGWFDRSFSVGNRTENVIAKVTGPGALVRIWSANPDGTLRLYLDGSTVPVLEERMDDLLIGNDPRFPKPFGAETSRGWTLYFPLPFARSCVLTTDSTGGDGIGLYYQVDYRAYAPDTCVESLSPSVLAAASSEVAQVGGVLAASPQPTAGAVTNLKLPPGVERVIDAPAGGGVVRELVAHADGADAATLRESLLIIHADGEETVRAPLDALFGGGPGLNPYSSLTASIAADGTMRLFWPMPFFQTLSLRLERASGGPPLSVDVRVTAEPLAADTLFFYAHWHPPEDHPTTAPFDWNLVTVDGSGYYVGNVLDVHYFAHSWWGEGDEKVWVDDDTFPRWFGTGTEDYFGFAWCSTQTFAHAYHAQIRADGPITNDLSQVDGYGYSAMNRWHVIDAIPFQDRIQFDLEVEDWPRDSHISLDAVSFYYAKPGAFDNLPSPSPAQLLIP
jgi:hypothetical protein